MDSKVSPPNKALINAMLVCPLLAILVINITVYYLVKQNEIHAIYYFLAAIDLLTMIYSVIWILIFYHQQAKGRIFESRRHMLYQQFKDIIENSNELIAALDINNKYIIFSEKYQEEFKKLFDKTITVGMTLDESLVNAPEYTTKMQLNWQRAFAGDKFQEEIEFNVGTYEVTSGPLIGEKNEVIGATHIIRNITRRIQQDKAIVELNEKLAYEMQELGIHNEKMTLLIELTDVLQSCVNIKEATKVIAIKCRRILHFTEGILYVMNEKNHLLEQVVCWGDPAEHINEILPNQCWALRKSRIYEAKNPAIELICDHILEKSAVSYMCIPLMAQNSISGLLYLEISTADSTLNAENRLLISAVTETLTLAIANIKLRETLRNQSLHDNLTGLYNRRYLDEFILREINLAWREQSNLAFVMIDIDYFKLFNDRYGHEVGDIVLREVGALLQNEVRVTDTACRYGGEEFLLILHNCNLSDAKIRMEDLRKKVSEIKIDYNNEKIDRITFSMGIAIYPDDALSASELIAAADKALYRAKKMNRNLVIAYSEMKDV